MVHREGQIFWSDNEKEISEIEDCFYYIQMQKGYVGVSFSHPDVDIKDTNELLAPVIQWAIKNGYDMSQPIDIRPYHDADYEGDDERYIVTVGGMIEIPEHLSLVEAIQSAERELTEYQGYSQEDAANIVRGLMKELGIIDIIDSEEENRYILLIDGIDDRGEGINLSTAIEAAIFELTDYKGYSLDDAEKIVYKIALPFINKF